MYPVKPTAGFEPTNPYEKAKHDICVAIRSFNALTPMQQERLVTEFFGAANVAAVVQLMQQILHRG